VTALCPGRMALGILASLSPPIAEGVT